MIIVVNTISTKRQSGGVYQIAHNFILETLKHPEIDWYYITSADVDELVGELFEEVRGTKYFVFPTQPDFMNSYRRVKRELRQWERDICPDVIYSIASPCYFLFQTPEVLRFANAWVTNPNKESWQSLSLKRFLRTRLYCTIQRMMLRKAKYIITQSETVKRGLVNITGLPENRICVVPNVLPKIFHSVDVSESQENKMIDIVCVAAPTPHKNLTIIPKVLKVLRDEFHLSNVRFHLTIPEGDDLLNGILRACKNNKQKDCIVNHGRCSQIELGNIYNKCRMCFLPSLLETFSASSLEAMYFQLPIVAADFDFNREVIDSAGLYYSPLDAASAASKIAELINSRELQIELKRRMSERIKKYSDYERYFSDMIDFLKLVGEDRFAD